MALRIDRQSPLTLLVVVALLVAACGQAGTTPGATRTATAPAGTEPAGTEPAGTEPAATEPAETEPAATEPGATEPTGTEPAGTEPAGTEPAGTPTPEPSLITAVECSPDVPVVQFWTSHTPPDSETLTAMVEQFNGANTDICVEMTIVPGSETDVTKLLTALRSGTAPDVYMVDRFTVPQRASDGVLAELTNLPPDLPGQHVEFAWNETQFQGKTYALPFDTDARALFYNKDMITAAGADPSVLDIANGAPTVAEVQEISDAIDTEDSAGNLDVAGFVPWNRGPGNGQGWHYTWGFAFGGEFADLAACRVTPTHPGVVAGFQFLYDWAAEHDPQKISRWYSTNLPPQVPTAQDPWYTGKLAMLITGDWVISQTATYAPDMDWDFTYIPVPEEGAEPATWAGGWSLAMMPDSDQPDGALRFMQWMTGPEGQAIYTKETSHLPTLTALHSDTSLYDEKHAVFLEFLSVAKNRPPLAVGATYWDALTTALDQVTLNTRTPEEALQEVETSVQPALDAVGC